MVASFGTYARRNLERLQRIIPVNVSKPVPNNNIEAGSGETPANPPFVAPSAKVQVVAHAKRSTATELCVAFGVSTFEADDQVPLALVKVKLISVAESLNPLTLLRPKVNEPKPSPIAGLLTLE
jgi:hypothetical protein